MTAVFRDRRTMARFASYNLSVWGEQMRSREDGKHSALYVGNMDPGKYRPVDDPHPNTFAILQVQTTLAALEPIHGVFAWHHWVLLRWEKQFRHPKLPTNIPHPRAVQQVRTTIVYTLADQLDTIDPRELTISENTLIEMRLRAMRDTQTRELRRVQGWEPEVDPAA